MKLLLYFVAGIIIFLCTSSITTETSEEIIYERISYLYKLRKSVAKKYWPGFADEKYSVPLIYYTDSVCYVANPTTKFLNLYKSHPVYHDKALNIYKTASRIDNVPFHMEVSISMGINDSAYYDFNSPFVRCSGYEHAKKVVPGTISTDDWAAMILHEFFHAYQFLHKSTAKYAYESHATVSALNDSLNSLYKKHDWYKKSIDAENNLLLKAIEAKNANMRSGAIREFFEVRNKRRLHTKEKLKHDIKVLESVFEKLEGTARYIEASVIERSFRSGPDKILAKIDPEYNESRKDADYAWLYKTEASDTYFYVTGYNMSRLLDKIYPDYKKELFVKGPLTLEELIYQHYQ